MDSPILTPAPVAETPSSGARDVLTVERIRELLDYDPASGVFIRRTKTSNRIKVGARAGFVNKRNGYRHMRVGGVIYQEHRVVWFYTHGRWPLDQIDHINGVRDDNRLANLREATRAENQQNLGVRRSNTSGHPGVFWDKDRRKWRAGIDVSGERKRLGSFEHFEDAAAAYLAAKAKFHTFNPEVRA